MSTPIPVHIRFSPNFTPLDKHALWSEPPLCLRRADGALDVRGLTNAESLMMRWVLGQGIHAELLSPPYVRQELLEMAVYLQKLYR